MTCFVLVNESQLWYICIMNRLDTSNPIVIGSLIALSIIQFAIKAFAIWKAARYEQRNWFVALFILIPLNDLAIVELIYLFKFAKKKLTIAEIRSWLQRGKQ